MSKCFRLLRMAWLVLLAGAWLLPGTAAFAQGGGQVILLPPDASHFPTITLNFEAYNEGGRFLTDLQAGDVKVMESDQILAVSDLSRQQPGLQVVVAFNPGPTLATATGSLSRLAAVKNAVADWARTLPTAPDDYNLVSGGTTLLSHSDNPKSLADAVTAYAPDLARVQPAVNSLIQALDLASDPLPRPLMKRTILYITPLLPDTALAALGNLAERAAQQGVRVFVWLALPAPAGAGESKAVSALADLAARSGGQLFTFTGSEPFPDLESYFQPLRYTYRLSYPSAIRKGGSYAIAVRVQQDPQALLSPEQRLSLDLKAPNPMFLEPPASIQLKWNQAAGGGQALLDPAVVQVGMLVEFPDGFTRPLTAARLYVDGKLASQRTTPPFDTLDWPVASLTASGKHLLRLEVEDGLGLLQSSIERAVQVDIPPAPPLELRPPDWLTPGLVLPVAGGVFVLALAGGGAWYLRRRRRLGGSDRATRSREPRPAARSRPAIPLPSLRRLPASASAPARLMRISESGHILPGSAIPLVAPDLSIGSDPKKSLYVLGGVTVSGLHARLVRKEGKFILQDAESEAGTWVNCQAVTAEGRALQHGDLVQLGLESFRFELNHPPPTPEITVTELDELP